MTYRTKTLKRRFITLWTTVLFSLVSVTLHAEAFDTLDLSRKISFSLSEIENNKYLTIAFSRIQGEISQDLVNELIDFTNVAIVKERRFRVIDRSKFQLIIKEQKYNLSQLISPDTYKELGKLLGVDLFVYGQFYQNSLVLKAIDVESSAIVWAQVFILTEDKMTYLLQELAAKTVDSMNDDVSRLRKNKVDKISFWDIKTDLGTQQVIDYLSVALTRNKNLKIIDRENLELIFREQQLSLGSFIDESKAKKMGELYGIDAFIYGAITKKNQEFIASLKMMNIYNGVIEWADLIQFSLPSVKTSARGSLSDASDEMVFVPAGTFVMGNHMDIDEAKPERQLPLIAFFIDQTEVSNLKYSEFVKKHRHRNPPHWHGSSVPSGQEKLPVVNVSWRDADRYCKSQGKRLPTEAEWEKAFRGSSGRKYPWEGDILREGMVNIRESGKLAPMNVDAANSDVSIYGVLHMAGNVREWVGSIFSPYQGNQIHHPNYGKTRTIRGGSWATQKNQAAGWFRAGGTPTFGWQDVGFRCAKSSPEK